MWSRRVMSVQLRKHPKFAAHVVGRFDLAAEGWAAQHQFTRTQVYRISEVRMAAWILTDDERASFVRKMTAKKRFELGEVEFLSIANGRSLVLKRSHVFLAPLSIGEQSGIVQVLKRVEGAQRKAISGKHKFAVGTVARHPCDAQSLFRGKL